MTILDIPRSGRDGAYVYYMRGRKLCRRRYFIPTNVRSAARRRARGAFGAIARAWSRVLTEEQRRAWNAAAAKVRSRPRLWQAGWRSGQTHFAGISNARSRIGREKLLLWPPEPVVFEPSPVAGLSMSEEQGRLRLKVRVVGPVVGDIMVFGAAPCSAGRKKWRHGAYLGLLPAPTGGESDITELYVARYGEPKAGERVFIRTRRQKDGWEDDDQDISGVVRAEPAVAAGTRAVEIRRAKAETRRKPENRSRNAGWSGGRLCSPGRRLHKRCTTEQYRSSPCLHRRNAVRARGAQEPLARLGRCAGLGRWLKSAGTAIGVSFGTALRRKACKVLYLGAVFPRVQAWLRSKAANSLVNSALRN